MLPTEANSHALVDMDVNHVPHLSFISMPVLATLTDSAKIQLISENAA